MTTQKLLDERPDWIKNNEVATGVVTYQTKNFLYTVLKKELAPDLPGFLGFPEGKHLFISEEVPEKFRLPQLIHEIVEFTDLAGQSNRCLHALKIELATVPEDIQQEYLMYRTEFFSNLVAYYEKQQTQELEEFKQEIAKSYEYLRSHI